MRNAPTLLFCAFFLAFGSSSLFSQNVSITYVNPPDLSVCDTAVFEVTVANTTAAAITAVQLTAVMPAGVAYAQGTIVNATEVNIGNLNAPVFSLPDIPSGSSHTLSFKARTECGLITAINAGDLFANTYDLTYSGGSKSVITNPFIIETALLQQVSFNNTNMSGTAGDVITRTWTLMNTRLGAISELVFTDIYGDGILVTTTQGTVVTNQPGQLVVRLSAADFQAFGDGDGLFELNEQVVITETIELLGCVNSNNVTSNLSAAWGCHGVLCQAVSVVGNVLIFPNPNNPNLVPLAVSDFPTDYCATAGNTQGLQFTNNGNLPANNVSVAVTHFGGGNMGLDPNSVMVTVAGTPISVSPNFYNQVQFSGCVAAVPVFDSMDLIIPTILPGQTAVITWGAYLCAVECGDSLANWGYDFRYAKTCPDDLSGQGSGISSGSANVPVNQFVTFYIGQFLEHGGTYELTYTLKSPMLVDSSGVLRVTIDLPCGILWGNNPNFSLAGNAPDSVDVVTFPSGGDDVTLYFTLPFGVDSVGSDFFIRFKCEEECTGPLPPCITEFVTSCPLPPGAGIPGASTVNVNTTLLLNTSQCGPQDCEQFDLAWFCEANTDSICYDTIIGYFNTSLEFHRENVGLPDNNNDRFADNGGSLNENLIRRDRVLAGDTIHTHVEGAMVIDIPGGSLPAAALVVNFEAHTADLGWDGGDTLNTNLDKELMVDNFGFKNLGGSVHIFDASTGQTYDCNLPTPTAADTLRASIAVVNTRPLDVIDQWLYLSYQYDLTPVLLNQLGCNVPIDFSFAEGDSIVADVYHKTLRNIGPYAANLRTNPVLMAWNPPGPLQIAPFYCDGGSVIWQYSGYRMLVNAGSYQMPPCETSDQPGGTKFSLRLAKANNFPFEFRSLAELVGWQYNVPAGATLLSAVLKKLEIQQGIVVASDVPVSWTQSGNLYSFDVDDLQSPLVDEGFEMEFGHEWDLHCSIVEPLSLGILATVDVASSLPQSDPTTITGGNSNVLIPLRPDLVLQPINPDFNGFSSTATWDFSLANNTADDMTAYNTWMTITVPSGLMSNFVLVNTTTGNTLTPVNGIYQLGDLPKDWMADFQLMADYTNCEMDSLVLTYGWSCEPFTPSNTDTCSSYTQVFTISPILGELEMDVISPTPQILQLCDTIPYHEVIIFNAQLGTVTDLVLAAELPTGLFIMPGTCEISYPTGSPWMPLADPITVGAAIVGWNLSVLNTSLGSTGLTGFDQPPTNSVSVRFRSATECGFVTPSQIIFNTVAQQSCGIPTNELSKPALPLFIEGVTPQYETNISIAATAPPILECGSSILMEVSMEADAPLAGTDSVFVLLPPGLAYLPGSYQPGINAVSGEPLQDFINNQFRLKWPLQNGLPANSPIGFSFELTVLPGGGCDSVVVEIGAYQLQSAVCQATGEECSILVETGRQSISIGIVLPALSLSNLQISQSNGLTEYSFLVNNNGGNVSQPIIVDLYFDADGSGSLTPGDQLLGTENWSAGLPSGASQNLNGSFDLAYSQLCNVIAVLDPTQNCTCTQDVEASLSTILVENAADSICGSENYPIGIPEMPGHSYQWQPNVLLDCPTCASTVFQATEFMSQTGGGVVILTLNDDNGMGCLVQNQWALTVGGQSTQGNEDLLSCENGTYNYGENQIVTWPTGQALLNDTLNNIITFVEAGSFTLSSTDAFGCESTTQFAVSFAEEFSVDSVGLCDGDSIIIDGMTYFDDILDCDTTFTTSGCEIISCNYYFASTGPEVEFPLDTVCTFEGVPVIINTVPGGFAGYSWQGGGLSCNDCPQPTAPGVTETYVLTISNVGGCTTSGDVTVQVILGCAVGGVQMPNVFSPNSDNTNDFFRPVYAPGVEKIVESAHLRIFDRWGKMVFEGEGVDVKWDGKLNNKEMASDVYVYMLEMTCADDKVVVRGDMTLVR